MYREIKNCIVCDVPVEQVFDMGEQYVVDFIHDYQKDDVLKCPLVLMKCPACNLVQLKHQVSPDRLYKKMWYRSGINSQMKNELLTIVQKAQRVVDLMPGDKVLDIGCNDGTLLGWYNKGTINVGIDPCQHLVEEGTKPKKGEPAKIDIGITDYFSADAVRSAFKFAGVPPPQFKIITAVAMFYDVVDPIRFLKDCKELLHGEGVLIIQMNYLKNMLETTGFDNISHEHLAYYTVMSLNGVVRRAGLELAGLELSKSNGGSLRAYITHAGWQGFCQNYHDDKLWLSTNVDMKIKEEIRSGLSYKETYEHFGNEVQSKMAVLKNYLVDIASKEPLYAYGASTRGTALTQYLFKDGGSEIVQGVAERDETKYGLKMVGTWWPIMPESTVRSKCHTMFVLPWHFKESFVDREKGWLASGGRFVFPLPKPEIVAFDNITTSTSTIGA